jgi:hypothetical protein
VRRTSDVAPASRRTRLALCAVLLVAAPAWAWRREIQFGTANAVTLHPSGDVIAAGSLLNGSARDLAVARVAVGSGAEVWRTQFDGDEMFNDDIAYGVVTDASGDVVAAGVLAESGAHFAVVKLDGTTGAEMWRTVTPGYATAVAVDAAGDVIATGWLVVGFQNEAVVRKFAGTTGAQLWEHAIAGTSSNTGQSERATDLVIDASGNAVVGGHLENTTTGFDLFVAKLDAATGGELWRREIDGGYDLGVAVALDGAGDAIAAGMLGGDFAVVKVAGATGNELWRQTTAFTSSGSAYDVALDAAGDAVASGVTFGPAVGNFTLAVLKVDGGTGAAVWSHEIHGAGFEEGRGVAVDAAGDVVVGGNVETVRTALDLIVVKYAGGTGAEVWRQTLTDANYDNDLANDVTVDGTGHVVAVGSVESPMASLFAVERLGGIDGAVGPVGGKSLTVKDRAGDPTARRILSSLKNSAIVVPPGGSAGDPTLFGATLRVTNEGTLEAATLPLPASGWVAFGNPPGSRGYQYADSSGANGPCRRVRAKRQLIRVNCLGSQGPIPFTLDEPTQGVLTISLQLGTADAQCARFFGNRGDAGTSNPGPAGIFDGRDAQPFSGTCP